MVLMRGVFEIDFGRFATSSLKFVSLLVRCSLYDLLTWGQRMDSAILTDKSLSSRLVLKETYCAVQWKGLFPVDNVIHFSNNWDQVYKWDQCTVPLEQMGEGGGGGGGGQRP